MTPATLRRTLDAMAEMHRRFAVALGELDPAWGSDAFALGSGVVALHGGGLFVNQACAVGIDPPLTETELAVLEERCAVIGVEATVEVSSLTHPTSVALLNDRGYRPDGEIEVFLADLDASPSDADNETEQWLAIEPVETDGPRGLTVWQQTAARGWGHETEPARRASDAYAAAAAQVDDPGLFLAIDRESGESIGCAALSITNGIAIAGGMSTVPEARGRGVQTALIRYRLRRAVEHGATTAVSTTQPGSASGRNLSRQGFRSTDRIVSYRRAHANEH